MAEEYDYLFKSIVLGDGGVGKTALTLRFSKGFFTEDYKMTIGVDFHVKTISIDTLEETIKCKLQLWDTGGQERFSSIRPMYYRGALGAVLVFDLTNYASFEHIPQWIEEVRDNIKSEIPLLLVGNKNDLAEQRTVSIEEINNFTRDFNLYYMETSAKTGDGVGDCFYILACLMIGSGVPKQLIKNQTVFSPGQITLEVSPVLVKDVFPPEPEIDYAAPPVPEPPSIRIGEEKFIHDIFKGSPEMDYAIPPVPSPPSLSIEKPINHGVEPERSLPKPSEIENEPIVNRIHENYLLIKLLKEKDKEIEQLKLQYELLNQELRSAKPSFESQSEDNLSNKERILNLLKSEHLTSNEIAEKLSLSKQDTRTYLQRLKKEDKIKVIEKKGRFLVYTLKKPLSSAKQYSAPESLEYDLSYLLNLMEMKMTPKDGVKFTPVDLMNIKKIEKRIADKRRENKQDIKALREFIDFEKTYKEEINEKLAELEAKVNYITSGVKLQQDVMEQEEEGFRAEKDQVSNIPISVKERLLSEVDYTTAPIPKSSSISMRTSVIASQRRTESIYKDKKKPIGIKTTRYFTKTCSKCNFEYPNWFTNCPKCGVAWDEAEIEEFEEELPTDKDSLYQELIALEGKRYSLEKDFKELDAKYQKGSIADIQYKSSTPDRYVDKFNDELKLSRQCRNTAVKIIENAKKHGFNSAGKDPKGIAAAAIYIGSKICNENRTQKEISKLARVTEVTLRMRVNDLMKYANIS